MTGRVPSPPTTTPRVGAVLDASAVLAWLRNEPGADVVERYLDEAVISAVNISEVHQKLAQRGVDADRTVRQFLTLGVRVEPFGLQDAVIASSLRSTMRSAGLSVGDRSCLALALRHSAPAITADRAWTRLDVGVTVVGVREGV